MSRRQKKVQKSRFRRAVGRGGIALLFLLAVHASIATWFVHHPCAWLDEKAAAWPAPIVESLYAVGNRVGDLTDALDLTGHDAVYEYDTEAPSGSVYFAGAPQRTGEPAPNDIEILHRGEFRIGWSPKLHHPLWCAYHVTKNAKFPTSRKHFQRDKTVPSAPSPGDYERSGYDRGHMVPNHAIVTRYGENAQKKTFLTSNITPQLATFNRGVWRDLEHRIADLWTARYGEIWVIVGCIPSSVHKTLGDSGIDIPDAYYQVVVAQEGMDVRAFAVVIPQSTPYTANAARYLIAIDELETLTGLDFLPELPEFIQSPLEAELPTRLWPIRAQDIFKLIGLGFEY